MKKYRRLSHLFVALAVLLSNVMCAAVAYHYCALRLGAQSGFSAPASIAFLLCIAYGAGIMLCAALAWLFYKKYQELQ